MHCCVSRHVGHVYSYTTTSNAGMDNAYRGFVQTFATALCGMEASARIVRAPCLWTCLWTCVWTCLWKYTPTCLWKSEWTCAYTCPFMFPIDVFPDTSVALYKCRRPKFVRRLWARVDVFIADVPVHLCGCADRHFDRHFCGDV